MEKNSVQMFLLCVIVITSVLVIPIDGINAEKNNIELVQWCCDTPQVEDDDDSRINAEKDNSNGLT